MQKPGQEGYLRSGRKLVQFLVLFCKEDRLDLVQSATYPGENLVLNLTIDPGRHITSTEWLERQREQPQNISRSGDDVGRSRFPQDRRTKAKDSHHVLYAVIEKLVRGISLDRMRAQKLMYLPRNLSTSTLYDGCDEARLVSRERMTKDLVRELVETRGCCVPCVTPR